MNNHPIKSLSTLCLIALIGPLSSLGSEIFSDTFDSQDLNENWDIAMAGSGHGVKSHGGKLSMIVAGEGSGRGASVVAKNLSINPFETPIEIDISGIILLGEPKTNASNTLNIMLGSITHEGATSDNMRNTYVPAEDDSGWVGLTIRYGAKADITAACPKDSYAGKVINHQPLTISAIPENIVFTIYPDPNGQQLMWKLVLTGATFTASGNVEATGKFSREIVPTMFSAEHSRFSLTARNTGGIVAEATQVSIDTVSLQEAVAP